MKTMMLNTKATLIASAISAVILTGCGGSGGTDDYSPPPVDQSAGDGAGAGGGSQPPAGGSRQQLSGGAVKGPITNANVTVYALDRDAPGLKGEQVASGKTDAKAAISGVELPARVTDSDDFTEQLFIVEFSGGEVIGTGLPPVIDRLQGVISGLQYSRDVPVYASPVTSMVLGVAAEMAKANPALSFQTLLSGSPEINGVVSDNAITVVKNAFGFGQLDDVNILSSGGGVQDAPLITSSGSFENSARHRLVSEALGAIIVNLQAEAGGSGGDLLASLAEDLADGGIDGIGLSGPITALSGVANLDDIVIPDPATLLVPNTTTPIAQIVAIMQQEATTTVPSLDLSAQPVPSLPPVEKPAGGIDTDGDGIRDVVDLFPANPKEHSDSDNDCGVFDPSSPTAGDGCGDNSDWAPNDPNVLTRCDPGALANGDTGPLLTAEDKSEFCADADGDGVDNDADLFPFNPAEQKDSDNDCSGDFNLPTSGNGCGDNSDFDICYSVQIEGQIALNDIPNSTTAHGVGKASLDTSKGILTAAIIQRPEVRDGYGAVQPDGSFPILADIVLRTYYSVDINNTDGPQSVKRQSGCVNLAPPLAVDACGIVEPSASYNANTQVSMAAGSYSIANNLSEIRFATTFNLIADVFSKHLFVETSRGPGGVTSCDLGDLPQSSVLAIPQTYTLP